MIAALSTVMLLKTREDAQINQNNKATVSCTGWMCLWKL